MSTAVPPPGQRPGRPPAGPASRPAPAHRGWYVLLALPFVGLLWLPFYAHVTPKLFGFPFFYWYQFLWVLIGAAITAVVYRATTDRNGDQR